MTQAQHDLEMNTLAEKYLTQLSEKDTEISDLRYTLSQWSGIAGALKLLGRFVVESNELVP